MAPHRFQRTKRGREIPICDWGFSRIRIGRPVFISWGERKKEKVGIKSGSSEIKFPIQIQLDMCWVWNLGLQTLCQEEEIRRMLFKVSKISTTLFALKPTLFWKIIVNSALRNSSSIFIFCCPSVHKRDILPFVHYTTFQTTQVKHFLKLTTPTIH